jgi:hypothetical protein
MSLTVGGGWSHELFHKVVDELLNGVSVEGELESIDSGSVGLSKPIEVTVVDHVGNHRVLGSKVGELGEEAGEEFRNPFGTNNGAGLGPTGMDWLADGQNLTGLQLPAN